MDESYQSSLKIEILNKSNPVIGGIWQSVVDTIEIKCFDYIARSFGDTLDGENIDVYKRVLLAAEYKEQ